MSDERFIKFIPSQKSEWLLKNHPNAFLLLTLIAMRARRVNGHPDGLEIGMAQIGDYKSSGIESERKYRTAKDVLIKICAVKIVETARKRKKSTTRTTTNGTLVILLQSDIWDVNPEHRDDRSDDRATTERRPSDDEQERRKKKKEKINKKESQPEKVAFRECVTLTQAEYDSLLDSYQQEKLDGMLDILDSFKESTGKCYKSDRGVLKQGGWVEHEWEKRKSTAKRPAAETESNREFAKRVCSEFSSRSCELKATDAELVFIPTVGQMQPFGVKYNENGFKDQIMSNLNKREFKKCG